MSGGIEGVGAKIERGRDREPRRRTYCFLFMSIMNNSYEFIFNEFIVPLTIFFPIQSRPTRRRQIKHMYQISTYIRRDASYRSEMGYHIPLQGVFSFDSYAQRTRHKKSPFFVWVLINY